MERRDAGVSRETASAGPSPEQVADLLLLYPNPGAAVSRAVDPSAEQEFPAQNREVTKSYWSIGKADG